MFLLGNRASPLLRVAIGVIGVALIAIGITQHEWGLGVAGGVFVVLTSYRLARRGRNGTGSSR